MLQISVKIFFVVLSEYMNFTKGAFKYYVITFLAFLGPPIHLFDDLQYCKSSKIAIFWPHPPTSLMM